MEFIYFSSGIQVYTTLENHRYKAFKLDVEKSKVSLKNEENIRFSVSEVILVIRKGHFGQREEQDEQKHQSV